MSLGRRNALLFVLAMGCDTATPLHEQAAAVDVDETLALPEIGLARDDRTDVTAPETDLRLSPADRATGTGETIPELSLTDSRAEIPSVERDFWNGRVRLVELSTGAVIDTSIDYVRPSFPERGDQEHRLLFRPRAPLNDGWHVLSVDVTGLDPRVDSSAVDHPDDNSYRVRFRADSHPILTGARIQTDDDSTLIELVASERLVVGMEDVSVRAAGRDVRCEWLGPSTAASGPDGMQAHVSLRCPFELADQIEVAFASRVATWQGVPLFGDDDTAPARIAWEPQSAEPFDDALRTRVYAFDLPGPY